jgi:biopolymer transport protein ExbB
MTEQLFSIAHYADQAVLWILIGLSVVSLGIILERFFFLGSIHKDSKEVLEKIELALKENRLSEIKELAKNTHSVMGKAATYALIHIEESGEKGLEEIFNTFSITLRPKMEKFLSFLGTIGSNAPYIGLLGTVLGIMKAFHDMTHATSDAGQKVVMAGISLALVATASGLAVAIPSVMFYNYFNKKVQSIFDALNAVRELCLAYAKTIGSKK